MSRVALVTGGTRGIGLAIARALATEGWRLALCGLRPPSEVGDVLDALRTLSDRVEYWPADVANPGHRAALVAHVRESFGCVNALVNNAGRAPRIRADLLDASEESFEDLMRTNLQGPYFLSQAIAREMLERRRIDRNFPATLVFVTSVSAELASTMRGEYCVSKAGLSMAARLFATRLAAERIPVYEVRPGIIATDMTARVKEVYDRRIAEGLVPELRWGEPADVGNGVAALLRGDLSYATGSVLHIDGGLALPRL